MAAADAEIERVEREIGEQPSDFNGLVTCSCGREMLDQRQDDPANPGQPDPAAVHRVLQRACSRCWAEDHPAPEDGAEPLYGDDEIPW
jgi:hypothetical protein